MSPLQRCDATRAGYSHAAGSGQGEVATVACGFSALADGPLRGPFTLGDGFRSPPPLHSPPILRRQESRSRARELLDAVVVIVSNEDVPAATHGDAVGRIELTIAAAEAAPPGVVREL